MNTLPSERPELPMPPLKGPRTDAWRIRQVSESAWHHLEDIRHRARQYASGDPEWAVILLEINLAQSHLGTVRRLADDKRRKLPLRVED